MKKLYSFLILFLSVVFILIEGCDKDETIHTFYNEFGLFENQNLVSDTIESNQIKFVGQTDTSIIFSRDSINYSFNPEKILAVFNEDVYGFFEINKDEFSELKLKKFQESEELKFKKEYLANLKKDISNTIIYIKNDFSCEDKYSLNLAQFDLTSTIRSFGLSWTIDKFLFKPENEDVALEIEESCNRIFIKIQAIITENNEKKLILFNPLKIELLEKSNGKIMLGQGILQNGSDNSSNSVGKLSFSSTSKGVRQSVQKVEIDELFIELPITWKKFQNRKRYDNVSELILSYSSKSKNFIGLNINKSIYKPIKNQNVYDYEDIYVNQIKDNMPSAKIINVKKERTDNKKSLLITYTDFHDKLEQMHLYENYTIFINDVIYTITFNYKVEDERINKTIIKKIKESIRFK